MGELLELRARSGTAEKYSVAHIAAGRCRKQCHKSLCQHYPKLLIKNQGFRQSPVPVSLLIVTLGHYSQNIINHQQIK